MVVSDSFGFAVSPECPVQRVRGVAESDQSHDCSRVNHIVLRDN